MGNLRVGASRRRITPDASYFPVEHFNNRATGKPSVFSGAIREDIYSRVIAIDADGTLLIWAVLDLPGVPEAESLRGLIASCAQVPEVQVMLTCTHNHSGLYADNPIFERWYGEDFTKKVKRYRLFLREVLEDGVAEALASMEAAKIGVGACECFLNVCRNEPELGPDAGTYGFLPGKEVDRTLTAIRFAGLDGAHIATVVNYPVHACAMIHNQPTGSGTEISGDFVGHACSLLEDEDGGVVAFTSGAAGDLNPLLMARVNVPLPDGSIVTKDLGSGGPAILEFMGNRFAMDARRAIGSIGGYDEDVDARVSEERFTLPHESVTLPGPPDPVEFIVGTTMLGPLGLISTNGEVFNAIGVRLKGLLPVAHPVIVTHAGPWTGYVKDDSGSGLYEVAASRAVEGNLQSLAL